MTLTQEAAELMKEAAEEITRLREDNRRLLEALKLAQPYLHEMDAVTDATIRTTISIAESR